MLQFPLPRLIRPRQSQCQESNEPIAERSIPLLALGDGKKKQEEQARHMKELQSHAKRLQRENDQLRAQIEKSRDLGKDVRDSSRVVHLIALNRGNELIILDDVDTPTDDE